MRHREPTESQIQASFIEWCRASESRYPALKLAFAVPNGSYRHIATAVRAKREGQRAGVPDWILPTDGWFSSKEDSVAVGLMLEFKRPGQKPTEEQKAYHDLATLHGHRVEIVTSAERAISIVKEYLS